MNEDVLRGLASEEGFPFLGRVSTLQRGDGCWFSSTSGTWRQFCTFFPQGMPTSLLQGTAISTLLMLGSSFSLLLLMEMDCSSSSSSMTSLVVTSLGCSTFLVSSSSMPESMENLLTVSWCFSSASSMSLQVMLASESERLLRLGDLGTEGLALGFIRYYLKYQSQLPKHRLCSQHYINSNINIDCYNPMFRTLTLKRLFTLSPNPNHKFFTLRFTLKESTPSSTLTTPQFQQQMQQAQSTSSLLFAGRSSQREYFCLFQSPNEIEAYEFLKKTSFYRQKEVSEHQIEEIEMRLRTKDKEIAPKHLRDQ